MRKSHFIHPYFFVLCIVLCEVSCQKSDKLIVKESAKMEYVSEINWMGHWNNEGKRQQLVSEIGVEFEFLNQETKVNLVFPDIVAGGSDAEQIDFIISQVTSPNPKFDIIRLKDYYAQVGAKLKDPNWGKKYLVDFSEFPDFVANQKPFLFSDEYKAQNGGITIGPYNEGFYWTAWFNKDLAEKMGIKIKQQGMTVDDFIGYIKATYEYNIKNGTSIAPLFEERDWITSNMLMIQMFYSAVGDINELKKTEFDAEKLKKLEKVLLVFEEISKYEPTFKNRREIIWGETFDYPLKEKCLFYVQGSWMYNIWDNIDKALLKNMYPAQMPMYNGTSSCYIGGYKACWAVLKNAHHKEEAIKLLKYWATPEVSELWVRYTKCPTGVNGNLTATNFGFDQFEDFQYNLSLKYGLNLVSPLDNRFFFGLKNKDVQIPSVIEIMEKRKTASEVMGAIRKQLKL